MWFATSIVGVDRSELTPLESQSPYGAKWFATLGKGRPGGGQGGPQVAIPLRGYVVCNKGYRDDSGVYYLSRNPLTGLCGLQLYPPKNALLDSTAGGGCL